MVAGDDGAYLRFKITTAFGNCRLIRLSSPTLNYFIVGGSLVMYTSVLFYVAPTYSMEATSAICNVSNKQKPAKSQLCVCMCATSKGLVLKSLVTYIVYGEKSPFLLSVDNLLELSESMVIVCM